LSTHFFNFFNIFLFFSLFLQFISIFDIFFQNILIFANIQQLVPVSAACVFSRPGGDTAYYQKKAALPQECRSSQNDFSLFHIS
jgi:hypothetical protein